MVMDLISVSINHLGMEKVLILSLAGQRVLLPLVLLMELMK
nr:MAG TPA: hypothetical protein [Caudoviricetes sp.]